MHADHRSRLGALVLTAALTAPLGAAPDQGILSHPGGRAPARDIACGPHATWDPPVAGMRVVAGGIHERSLFGPGDVVIVDAGRTQGLEPGQEFFVRRVFRDRFLTAPRGDVPPMSVRTAGWVRLVEVRDDVSTAQVVQVCDAIAAGDHLEPFALPVVPAPGAGEPDYADPARILMGDERRQTARRPRQHVVEAAVVVDGRHDRRQHGDPERDLAQHEELLEVMIAEDQQQDRDHLRDHLELAERRGGE
jgi:hypothetical protein